MTSLSSALNIPVEDEDGTVELESQASSSNRIPDDVPDSSPVGGVAAVLESNTSHNAPNINEIVEDDEIIEVTREMPNNAAGDQNNGAAGKFQQFGHQFSILYEIA
ncbi:hypothetical protein F511_35159 [Dorcoceras hygrometricum]|uniref:Uncharacterized protein n=1 Tax=Dorcoceras hygrometricum TaxID=472368 RepID=A0A2Z7DC28_9LAMI|nr:hypothetical protein F511_35159 [Dorcoceras hygrometricum]